MSKVPGKPRTRKAAGAKAKDHHSPEAGSAFGVQARQVGDGEFALSGAPSSLGGGGGAQEAISCQFTVIIDTREQLPYMFQGLETNTRKGRKLLIVPTKREKLEVGDYSIEGFGRPFPILIERKSKQDLWSSISQARDNFRARLQLMMESSYVSFIVVETDIGDILANPPKWSNYPSKSLWRTVLSWMIKYPDIHWLFMPSRAHAEAVTFRLLEKYWEAWNENETWIQNRARRLRSSPGEPLPGNRKTIILSTVPDKGRAP